MSTPSLEASRTVLASLLGKNPYEIGHLPYDFHPYARDYPENLIVTFEKGQDGRVYRIFFAIYGQHGGHTAELRNLPLDWPSINARSTNPELTIEHWWESRKVSGRGVVTAFLEVARAKFTGVESDSSEEGEDDAL